MARSTYIYIVATSCSVIDSAFTVKYEMINSLPDILETFESLNYRIYRTKDGGRKEDLVDITTEVKMEAYE